VIDEFIDKLTAPFSPDAISWRVGSTNIDKQTNKPREGQEARGLALAYLDARDVMDRLDLVCGADGWQNRYSHVGPITVCEIGILLEGTWLWKSDGAGASDIEAEKGALSDAFKRAAVRWGIGRYLYALPSPWVALKAQGRSWIIADTEYGKLRSLLASHSGFTLKSAAQAKKDQDFEFFKAKIAAADDMEILGAVGREIKVALPMLPAAQREPLQDAYLLRREELKEREAA
jgi:hypothetical protein